MGQVNQPEDLIDRIRALERQVKELARGNTLNGAVLSQGTMEVRDPDGHVMFKFGQFSLSDNSTVWGWAAYRRDGTLQMWAWDAPGGTGYWSLFDEQQNALVSNDTNANQGLATPYLGAPVVPWSQISNPPELTTSATFASIHRVHFSKQHPWIRVRVVTKVDAGSTGEIRLAVGGVAITSVVSLPDGDYSYRTLEGPVAGAHLSYQTVDVDARRVTGAGNIRVLVTGVEGRQS